ncbi:hypothetical protein [Methylobacterium brachiatum]|uniref:Pam3-gp28 family putative phage holin n=1 Tax=Methylobacterium brachiatum TaxID=269660 RepID=UPI000EFAF630|nr:hypothetical protein [Methylobacterium brachiatum]AYO83558.1 hypothetical protein EBB05_15640 [Methylobacterium brachiatum]
MTPQTLSAIRWVLTLAAGVLASRGVISQETQAYIAGPETLAFVAAFGAAATLAWGLWSNRPHGIIQNAAALPQVDAVITKPKTADEIPDANVVGSLTEASRIPGVTAR